MNQQRQIAYKISIGDLLKGKVSIINDRFNYLEVGGKKVARVSLIANIIEKYVSTEKSFISLTIDDGTGQIRIKLFEHLELVENINIGDTILIIGWVRYYNNELYVSPDIIKKLDVRWTLARKIELEKEYGKKLPLTSTPTIVSSQQPQTAPAQPPAIQEPIKPIPTPQTEQKEEIKEEKIEKPAEERQEKRGNIKEDILKLIQENEEGINIDKLIMALSYPVSDINTTITQLIEKGDIYEPQPGKVRSIS